MRFIVMLVATLIFSGCGPAEKLRDHLNEEFPALSLEEQRDAAIDSVSSALDRMPGPGLMASVELETVEHELAAQDWSRYGIHSLAISGEDQLLRIVAGFTLSNSEGDESAKWFSDLESLDGMDITLAGNILMYFGVNVVHTVNDGGEAFLDLKLLPRLHTVEVDRVTIGDFDQFTPVAQALVGLFNKLSDRLNGRLSKETLNSVSIPSNISGELETGRISSWSDNGSRGVVKFRGKSVQSPVELSDLAPFVDHRRIAFLAQFLPVGAELIIEPNAPPVKSTFSDLKKRYETLERESFGELPDGTDALVGVRKDLLSYAVNRSFQKTQICLSASSSIPKQSFREKISIPHEDTISCSSDRSCNIKRDCSSIRKSKDTRSCRACLLRAFGRCQVRGNDPICEASKAAQNAIYQTDYNARVLDCNRIREMRRVACMAEKATEKALCETGKEVVKRINRTGNFANLGGAVEGVGTLNACLGDIRIDEGLTKVEANLSVAGRAKVDASLKFVPLDIVGHLTCQAPFTEDRVLEVDVSKTSIGVSASLVDSGLDDSFYLEYEISPTKVSATLDPGPTEILLTSVNSTLACQGLNMIKPLVIGITPFVPELQGNFDFEPDTIRIRSEIELPRQVIADRSLQPRLYERQTSYFLGAKVLGE
ncbi:MAG: hypothetical protein AAF541_23455 [Pseudomonadota bacterium]